MLNNKIAASRRPSPLPKKYTKPAKSTIYPFEPAAGEKFHPFDTFTMDFAFDFNSFEVRLPNVNSKSVSKIPT